jgi:hypothetical protein
MPDIRDTIERLRETEPPLLTVARYQFLMGRCQAAACVDFKRHPNLAIKSGRRTLVVRDVALDLMGRLPAWTPERDRVDEKDKPYAQSRHRARTANGIADAVKPPPAAASSLSRATSGGSASAQLQQTTPRGRSQHEKRPAGDGAVANYERVLKRIPFSRSASPPTSRNLFGPWSPAIAPVERITQLRSLAALAAVFLDTRQRVLPGVRRCPCTANCLEDFAAPAWAAVCLDNYRN